MDGYYATSGSYTITPTATFNKNNYAGLDLEADFGAPGSSILANVLGGSFNNDRYGLFAEGSSIVNVYGGRFGSNVLANIESDSGAAVNIYGGTFGPSVDNPSFRLETLNGGAITLYGSGFTQNGALLLYGLLNSDGSPGNVGSFSGKLQNEGAVQTFTFHGTVTLAPGAAPAVPEPSSFALLALGLLPASLAAARRRRSA